MTALEEILDVAREVMARWGEALDLMGGICPTCRHPLEAARPDGGDGIYTWCGVAGCACAHHSDPVEHAVSSERRK